MIRYGQYSHTNSHCNHFLSPLAHFWFFVRPYTAAGLVAKRPHTPDSQGFTGGGFAGAGPLARGETPSQICAPFLYVWLSECLAHMIAFRHEPYATGRLRRARARARMAETETEVEMGRQLGASGRAPKELIAELEGELDFSDLDLLATEKGTEAPKIVKLRERHHALARHLAEGKTQNEAALLTRYDPSRVSVLLGDPAFNDLVAHYREQVNREYVDFQRKLAELGVDAAHVLQERIEEKPEEISDALLLRLVEVSADRTGHGPSSKTEVNVKVGIAARLSEARERSLAAMRDVTPKEIDDGHL